MISAFGETARRYAAGLGDLDAIVADQTELRDAYIEAVARREAGKPFYGMVLLEDQRTKVALSIAHVVLSQIRGIDERLSGLEDLAAGRLRINDKAASELWTLERQMRLLGFEFFSLCDAMLTRSCVDFNRIAKVFSRTRPFTPMCFEPALPEFERRPSPRRPQIVVWAPHTSALDVALPAFGLEEFQGEVICIVRSGTPLPGLRATFVQAGSAQAVEALAGAAAVLCADPYDPGPAVAFARRGFGIVASELSGAQEYIDGAVSVDPASARGLQIAAAVAVGRPASLRRELAPPMRAPVIAPAPIPASELPLVSIVTATYNRHADLRRMLTCLRDQTYPRIESIVVNDCGEPIEEVVAEFPFARVLNQEVNAGPIRAGIRGTREAKGSFIGYLPDDDWLYPDHVERLVNAMLRSGAWVGHSNTLIRFQQQDSAGEWQTTAYTGAVFNATATPTEALYSTPIAGQSLMFRREVFDEIGDWLPDSVLSDQEFQCRAMKHYLFVHVDNMTGEWRSRAKGNISTAVLGEYPEELRRIFNELHPVPDRPKIQAIREATIANVAKRPADWSWPQTLNLY